MSLFSSLKGLFGIAPSNPAHSNDRIKISAGKIISILAESLQNKNRASSPEMLLALGTLAGQLALRSKLGDRVQTAQHGDSVLIEGATERVFELQNILKYNCEKGPLKKALIEGVKLPEIESDFIIAIVKECFPKIELVFSETELPAEQKDLAAVMAILFAIQTAKDDFHEDISGTLPYITHAMVAGSHMVIK
jgi:hypothetical protein